MPEVLPVPSVQPLQQQVVERVFEGDTSARDTPGSNSSKSDGTAKSAADVAAPPSPLSTTHLSFSVNRETGDMIIRVIDSATDEVIRQIPPEEFIRIATRLAKMVGLLFDHRT